MMNGYDEKNVLLDEDAFGPSGASIVSAFDAFPKSKPQYVTHTATGGKWTVGMAVVSLILIWSEFSRWWAGSETHTFAVEKGVSQSLQINLDIVVKMKCSDLHINVQDASGDRILAASKLQRDNTNWAQWVDNKGMHRLGKDEHGRLVTGEGWESLYHEEGFGEEHIHDIVALGRRRARWGKTPKLWRDADSCRIFGNLDVNKVQGDFHITARGHGYMEFGDHLDHTGQSTKTGFAFSQGPALLTHGVAFNFSHIVSELSFGAFLPSLQNPLDRTVDTTPAHFHKFQYFISVVPTVYSIGDPNQPGGSTSIFTNQYAVTEQSTEVNERMIPGIFFKYDIEPIMLTIVESRDSFFVFLIKVINVVSGALVAGHWGFTLTDWFKEVMGRRRRSGHGNGMLGVKDGYEE